METSTPLTKFAARAGRVLINRNFGLLWTGQAISYIGDFVFDTTLVLWIALQVAAGQSWAPLAVSGVLISVAVPDILVGPFAGVFVDRWDKRRTMLAMDAIRALLISALIPITVFGTSWPVAARLGSVYAAVVLATICQQFFGPSRVALIGDIVEPAQQTRASGMAQMTIGLAAIFGPPLAPPLLLHFGIGWALGINALSFVASFATILAVQAPRSARSVRPGERGNAWREFAQGLTFFAGNRILTTILITGVIIMLGAGALNVLDVFFALQNLHASPSLYGWLTAAFGGGAMVGAVVISVLSRKVRNTTILWTCLMAGGAMMVLYSRMNNFVPGLIALFLIGIPIAGVNMVITPLMLETTPRELIGRASAVLNPAISLASVVSMALSGILVSTVLQGVHGRLFGLQFGPVDSLFSIAGFMIVGGAVFAMLRLRGVPAPAVVTPVEAVAS